jgi:hypothetical protein
MPVVLAKVFEALEASRLSSKGWLCEPEDTVTGGLAFCKATAVLRLVCRRWKALHDAMVRRLHASWQLKITGEATSLLLRFPAVTSVRFRQCDNADDVVRAMSMHPVWCTLQTLDLRQCLHSLTDNSLQAVSGAPALTTLSLAHCLEVTDAGIQTISSMPALTWLDLSGCKITDEALRSVSRLPALKELYLEGCETITHVGLQAVSRMPTLKLLHLRRCVGVTDEAVKALSRMSSLTSLHLGHCSKVSQEAMLALIGMPALETLFLAHCDASGIKGNHRHENPDPNQLTFENMKALIRGLPALTYLDLRFCSDDLYDGWGWMLEKEGWKLKEHSEEVEGGWMLEVKEEKKPKKRKKTANKTDEGPNPELRIILSDEDITLPQFLEGGRER